jgi:prepilin-type N-terminal cleavage/methylation domain-containing protein
MKLGVGDVGMRAGAGRRRRRARRGFTLIETALTTVIIGVGVLALIDAQQAFMRTNNWSTQAATATYLANEVRELSRKLPRHDPVTGLYLTGTPPSTVLNGWGPEVGEVTAKDFDDIDDLDGMVFGNDGTPGVADHDLPGPIDAFGNVIPEILANGEVMTDGQGNPRPMQGWSQAVRVQKVDPFDMAQVRPNGYTVAPVPPDFAGLRVDQFPLRVSVTVRYQGPFDAQPSDIVTVSWVVP